MTKTCAKIIDGIMKNRKSEESKIKSNFNESESVRTPIRMRNNTAYAQKQEDSMVGFNCDATVIESAI